MTESSLGVYWWKAGKWSAKRRIKRSGELAEDGVKIEERRVGCKSGGGWGEDSKCRG